MTRYRVNAQAPSPLAVQTAARRGAAYLLGHPSHRGWLRKVRCNFNYMETATTSIEPNFQLDQYEVIGNVIKVASKERIIACTNCGMAPMRRDIAEAKLMALGAGAKLARERLG